jgi:hypothetical protein
MQNLILYILWIILTISYIHQQMNTMRYNKYASLAFLVNITDLKMLISEC